MKIISKKYWLWKILVTACTFIYSPPDNEPWARFETCRGCSWSVVSVSLICVSFCHVAFSFLKLY